MHKIVLQPVAMDLKTNKNVYKRKRQILYHESLYNVLESR